MAIAINFSLSGGVSDSSANIVGRGDASSSTIVIEYADNPSFTGSLLTAQTSTDSDFLIKASLSSLSSDTTYYYRYVDDGDIINDVFKFKTVSLEVPLSFTMGFGACPRPTTSSLAWGRIRDRDVLFFQSLGDTTYIDSQDVTGNTQKTAWFNWLSRSDVREMNDNVAYSYMWDDHDYGDNDDDSTNPAKSAQQANYRNIFPSHPLELGSGSIYYAYTVGRVRVIVPDLRSERLSPLIMSTTQMDWVKQELTDFNNNASLKVCIFVSSSMWSGLFDNTAPDSWEQASAQRTELTDHILSLGIEDRIALISGDIHVLCGDSGANNKYGTSGGGGFPIYHSAPLAGTTYGTPNTNLDLGFFNPDNGGSVFQYATLEIQDTGSTVFMTYRGYDATSDTELLSHSITVDGAQSASATMGFVYTPPDVTGTLNNFPILLTSGAFPPESIDGGDDSILNGGGNLQAFTDQSKTTRLPINIVRFNVGTVPDVVIYVKHPELQTGATIYFEASTTQTEQPARDTEFGSDNVWSEYTFVTHDFFINETDGSSITNVGVVGGVNEPPTKGVSGFFGSNTDYSYLDVTIPSLSSYTSSCWVRPTSGNTSGLDVILLQNPTAFQTAQSSILIDNDPNDIGFFNTPDSWLRSGVSRTNNQWTYISASNDGSLRDIKIGDSDVSSSSNQESTTRTRLRVGARFPQTNEWLFAGEMAEVRVRSEKLSLDFRNAEKENQEDPDNWGVTGDWISVGPSTFSMTNTGTPDGTYTVDYYNSDTKLLIFTEDLVFSGGDATAILNVPSGTNVFMFEPGDNPPVTGICYTGVTT